MENLRQAIMDASRVQMSFGIPSPVRLPNEPESDIVQVRGDDGVFQQGRIVDCAKGGLLIDWECNGRPASNFVPFGEIYLHKEQESWKRDLIGTREDVPVEVLVHLRPNVRTWYPGVLIVGYKYRISIEEYRNSVRCCVVKAALPDGVKFVVVPERRIRKTPTADELEVLRVQHGHFFTQTLDLPAVLGLGGHFAEQIVKTLNWETVPLTTHRARTLIRAVRMDDKTLTCIRIGYGIVPEKDQYHAPEELRRLLLGAVRLHDEPSHGQGKRKLSEAQAESSESESKKDIVPGTCSATYGIHCLPKHILVSIFDQLDRVEQCRLRPVCARWDRLLTTAQYIVRIYYRSRRYNWMSLASLHDGWTLRTKIIVNKGLHSPYEPLLCGGHLFQRLVQNCGHVTVNTVILADLNWNVTNICESFSISFGRLVKQLNDMASVCQKILLRGVIVRVAIRCVSFDVMVSTLLHIVTGQITGSLTIKELWARMEDNLPALSTVQWQELAGLTSTSHQWSVIPQRHVLNVLNDRQSNDPREDAHYSGCVWTADNVGTLDMRKLSKLTLHTLAAVRSEKSMTIALSW